MRVPDFTKLARGAYFWAKLPMSSMEEVRAAKSLFVASLPYLFSKVER
jgi:hypothetical protein